ncbi:MAG TPA: hypothetical protein DCY79_08500 [Planctomycetaceae bacterium]|nr:hypothetical protein [Blastopirellula sp.]HAY79831.1 hypothetical protein [Planctomycetaceae bacterium]
MIYPGPYGTQVNKNKYDRVIAESSCGTVNDLILRFFRHTKLHYRNRDGQPASTASSFQPVIRALKQQYGTAPVERFTPKS